jgi:hypothetical protein
MRIYLLLDEERREWDARSDAGPWPNMIADWQDAIWLHLSDEERAQLNARGQL